MTDFTIMTYNVENMGNLFHKNQFATDQLDRINSLSHVINRVHPHILGIVEASRRLGDHERFLQHPLLQKWSYHIAKSTHKRGRHDLVFYYRDPFEIISVDGSFDFYNTWVEDIDDDGIKEVCEFERKPLEALFHIKGTDVTFLVILIAAKSKGVFTVNDLHIHQQLALANRKKMLAQSRKIRERLDLLMDEQPQLPIIVMGDFNDEPGLDSYQKLLGASSVETVMGCLFEPDKIMHNTLWYLQSTSREKALWTMEYPDLIVKHLDNHRIWIDHILVSPNMLDASQKFFYKMHSGDVVKKDEDAKQASDHYPVYCTLQLSNSSCT